MLRRKHIMRKFMINVNGKSYEVEVEEVREGVSAAPTVSVVPEAAKAAAPAPAPKAAPAGAKTIVAPMPGTILSVNVKAGEAVKKGQVLCILEAMKMENEIMAGSDGTITSVAVAQGDSVNTGQVLFVLG
jgi:glutaconyl-CoA decarboxylase